jgi:hypothetical protein
MTDTSKKTTANDPQANSRLPRGMVALALAFLLVDFLLLQLPIYVPRLSISGTHWNWSGKIFSIVFSCAVLACSPWLRQNVGLRLRQSPGSLYFSLGCFLLCAGAGIAFGFIEFASSFLTRDPPVSDAHASTRRRVSNSGHSFGIAGARIRMRPYGLPIALRTSGIGDVAAFRSRPFRHLDRRSFHSFADSIYQHVRLCFHCSVGAHTVGQSCLADALSFRVGRTIIFRVDDSMIKSPNKSPNPRAAGAVCSAIAGVNPRGPRLSTGFTPRVSGGSAFYMRLTDTFTPIHP